MVLHPKFLGKSTHVADDRARIALPSRFRDVVSASGENSVIISPRVREDCLTGRTLAEFYELAGVLWEKAKQSEQARKLHDYLVGESEACGLDKQGRILIPQEMREEMGIVSGTSVILVGLNTMFRIWRSEIYKPHRDKLRTEFGDDSFRDVIVEVGL